VVDKGVSLAPMYPQLQCGNQTYVVLWELNVG